jgi:hypothetical protein
MEFSIDTIFGVRLGAEFIPKDVAQNVFGDDAEWGFMVDIFIISFMIIKTNG